MGFVNYIVKSDCNFKDGAITESISSLFKFILSQSLTCTGIRAYFGTEVDRNHASGLVYHGIPRAIVLHPSRKGPSHAFFCVKTFWRSWKRWRSLVQIKFFIILTIK